MKHSIDSPPSPPCGGEPPSHPETTVSVIICAFTDKRRAQIVDAVASVLPQLRPRDDLILVIDHNPGLLEWARLRWPHVSVVENSGQPGLSDARNTGLERARGEVVAFLDDDAVAEQHWLSTLITRYDDANVVAVGGKVTPRWVSGRPPWFPPEFDWVVGCVHLGMPKAISPVRNVIGANMSFRRAPLVEIGGFRRGLGRVGASPMGCEETDVCIRARSRGGNSTILYDPEAQVDHTVPRTRASFRYFMSRCAAEGKSKAMLAGLVGTQSGLSDERRYVRRTLPMGVLVGIKSAVGGDLAGLARAGAIVVGLAATLGAYAAGRAVEVLSSIGRRGADNA